MNALPRERENSMKEKSPAGPPAISIYSRFPEFRSRNATIPFSSCTSENPPAARPHKASGKLKRTTVEETPPGVHTPALPLPGEGTGKERESGSAPPRAGEGQPRERRGEVPQRRHVILRRPHHQRRKTSMNALPRVEDRKTALVLLSGGLDSTTALAIAKDSGFQVYALTFRYGQRHAIEITAAQKIAQACGVLKHGIVDIDLRVFGGSALTADIPVPKHRAAEEIGHGIPVTYVPARNTIFLSLALAWAEVIDSQDIFIAVNALDYSGYPDCRPEFISAFERAANLGTRAGSEGRPYRIHTPLIQMTKAQIITSGSRLGVDYSLTLSCYDPDPLGHACGECDSCLLRARGFAEAGIPDPTPYQRPV